MILKIHPESPFNFELSTKIFSVGDPQIQRYENGSYWQVIKLNKRLILVTVISSGTIDEPELCVTLKPDNELNKKDLVLASEMISAIFNLNSHLRNFYDDVKEDPIMSKLTGELKGLTSPSTPTIFEAIVSSIIEQQISLKAARSIETRMTKNYGEKLKMEDNIFYGFPSPETLSKLKSGDLRRCGLSFRKAEYVIGLAKLIESDKLDLDKFKTMDAPDIIRELLKIRGIGVWTAELAVLRGMHRLDVVPADDLGLKRIVSNYYTNGEPISGDELRKIANNWGKWSGLAAFYLIIADLMSIKI